MQGWRGTMAGVLRSLARLVQIALEDEGGSDGVIPDLPGLARFPHQAPGGYRGKALVAELRTLAK